MIIKILLLLISINLILSSFCCNEKYLTYLGYYYANKYLINYSCKLISFYNINKTDNIKIIENIKYNQLYLSSKQLSKKLNNNILYNNNKPLLIKSFLIFKPNINNKYNILSIVIYPNIIKFIIDLSIINLNKLKYVEILNLDYFNKNDNKNDTFVFYF